MRVAVVHGRPTADLAGEAAQDADLVVLPEGVQSYELIRQLAQEHDTWIAGGCLLPDGGHTYSAYLIAEPDGATHVHMKDEPDPWESHLATNGIDDGFCSTPRGPIGLASGLELLRSRTAQRLRGYVRLIAGGTSTRHAAPQRLARTTGAPVAISHPVASRIVARDGRLLASTTQEGFVVAEVDIERDPAPLAPIPDAHWLATMQPSTTLAWRAQSLRGRARYRRTQRPDQPRRIFAYNGTGAPLR
jgi:hypothetical protein